MSVPNNALGLSAIWSELLV